MWSECTGTVFGTVCTTRTAFYRLLHETSAQTHVMPHHLLPPLAKLSVLQWSPAFECHVSFSLSLLLLPPSTCASLLTVHFSVSTCCLPRCFALHILAIFETAIIWVNHSVYLGNRRLHLRDFLPCWMCTILCLSTGCRFCCFVFGWYHLLTQTADSNCFFLAAGSKLLCVRLV